MPRFCEKRVALRRLSTFLAPFSGKGGPAAAPDCIRAGAAAGDPASGGVGIGLQDQAAVNRHSAGQGAGAVEVADGVNLSGRIAQGVGGEHLRRLQNLLRRFCKRRIQKPEFSIQNWNPLTGNVYYYSDS